MIIHAIPDGTIPAAPVLVQNIPGYPEYSALAFYDVVTGQPMWLDSHYEWHVTPADAECDTDDAETITGVYAENEATWERVLNERLADYGMRLGQYVADFDFTIRYPHDPIGVTGHQADGYTLEPVER